MGKTYTKKSRFQSKYSDPNTFVSDGQYLAELICERIAKKEKKLLPYKFWNTPEWKNTFIKQTTQASRLLKEYDVFVILDALKDGRARKIYSLGARFVLDPLLKEHAKKRQSLDKLEVTVINIVENDTIRPTIAKKNVMGDLDG